VQIIRKRAYARAGLIGNPSDGYNGRTLAISVRNFFAEVVLYEWDEVEVVLSQQDRSRFRSISELARDVQLHGYYGGIRLVKAAIKKFVDYCERLAIPLDGRNFSARYETNVPRQVGLGGSSAIIVATLRALMEFYGVEIPLRVQPSLALSVETEELGIAAGLQDRVIQVYEGAVAMDFAVEKMEQVHGFPCGHYETVDAALLPPLYVAYHADLGEPTEVLHNNLRARFGQGDADVVSAMERLRELTDQAVVALESQDVDTFAKLIDTNFEIRRSICRLPAGQVDLIERARAVGATAKFAGSGGAIVGTLPDRTTFARLQETMAQIGCTVIKPRITRN